MITAYLATSPRDALSADEVIEFAGRPELEPLGAWSDEPRPWSKLLPELRARRRTTRLQLIRAAGRRARREGIGRQVAGYVHELEAGLLSPRGSARGRRPRWPRSWPRHGRCWRRHGTCSSQPPRGADDAVVRPRGTGARRRDPAFSPRAPARSPRRRPVHRRRGWMRRRPRCRRSPASPTPTVAAAAGRRGGVGREPLLPAGAAGRRSERHPRRACRGAAVGSSAARPHRRCG